MRKRTDAFMGTFVMVAFELDDAGEANALFRHVFGEMRAAASRMNHFDPDSEIGRLNSEGRLSGASDDTIAVLRKALHYSRLSDGAFDISSMPLVRLWGRCARDGTLPSANDTASVAGLADYRNIVIEDDSVRFLRPSMQVSLAGIAKGYIVDKAIARLRNSGVVRAMVDGGGDVRVIGDPSDPPWRIGVTDPRHPKNILCVLNAHNRAVASSGPYAHAYNDIVDPRTGEQTREVIGVSVIADETAGADALATCISVLGPKAGAEFAEKQRERKVAALIVSSDGTERKTSGWNECCARPYRETRGGKLVAGLAD
jgi:thiamine biosynthesis lipoprotein